MSINSIEILDCTLRDGGYLNDWEFGENAIKSILKNLTKSGIDYIELGFLKQCEYCKEKTFFPLISDIEYLLKNNQKYTLMINFGEYDIQNFSECNNKNIKIRVAFKKHNQNEAIKYINSLKKLNWDVFANPMNTNTYTNEELKSLIVELNKIKPYGVTIVDTFGNMYENDVIQIFQFIDENLDKEISIGFHSHNNMQLSFSNAKALLKMDFNRNLIIDSCLYGMGRGAGNLCTELIIKYLNDNINKNYKISPIISCIENNVKKIYEEFPWGYSTPYYIAAIYNCHPNYAGYLVKQGLSDEKINTILSNIPQDKKTSYDKVYIEKLFK